MVNELKLAIIQANVSPVVWDKLVQLKLVMIVFVRRSIFFNKDGVKS